MIVSFRRQYPKILFPGQTQFEAPATSGREYDDHRAKALPIVDSLNPLSWRRAARVIEREGCDTVVINHWLPFLGPSLGSIARRLRRAGIKTVVIVHNALPHERRPGDKLLTNLVLRPADKRISLSKTVHKQLDDVFGVSSVVVPHPVYDHFGPAPDRRTARDSLDLPPDAEVLLFFGFVRQYKGLDVLLQAMPKIVASRPTVRLVVAGEFYESQQPYRDAVARLAIGEHVRFDDAYIPADLVPSYFAAADVVVQPYRSATQSGVAQIAFNYSCPVITTDVGGLTEIVDSGVTGIVVDRADPSLVADAVVRFFADNLSDAMRRNIAQAMGAHSWESLAIEIEQP